MSLKHLKEQLTALRGELDRQTGREWITIRTHPKASDDEIANWLNVAVGLDWRRHFITRMDDSRCTSPRIEARILSGPVPSGPDGFTLRFSEADAAIL